MCFVALQFGLTSDSYTVDEAAGTLIVPVKFTGEVNNEIPNITVIGRIENGSASGVDVKCKNIYYPAHYFIVFQ